MIRRPPRSTLFPTRRSSDLETRWPADRRAPSPDRDSVLMATRGRIQLDVLLHDITMVAFAIDRKSTRLNSSHSQISYAVFCLKKKNNKTRSATPNCVTPSSH